MLSSAHRLTDAASFREVVRKGRRASSPTVVTHTLASSSDLPPRVGFVVSKAVGNSVVRGRVQRRLRHLARDRVSVLGAGQILVVRALPPAAAASSAVLGRDLDRCLARSGVVT